MRIGDVQRSALLLSLLLLAGCSPTPGSHLSAPAADDMATRQVVAHEANSITPLLPASPTGAVLGVEYRYTMPHCGALGPIDVDGSFWNAAAGDGSGVDGVTGVLRLVTPDHAVFTTDKGASISLTRHDGAKQFPICS